MIRRPPRSTLSSSSAASDVYKRQIVAVVIWSPVQWGKADNLAHRGNRSARTTVTLTGDTIKRMLVRVQFGSPCLLPPLPLAESRQLRHKRLDGMAPRNNQQQVDFNEKKHRNGAIQTCHSPMSAPASHHPCEETICLPPPKPGNVFGFRPADRTRFAWHFPRISGLPSRNL